MVSTVRVELLTELVLPAASVLVTEMGLGPWPNNDSELFALNVIDQSPVCESAMVEKVWLAMVT